MPGDRRTAAFGAAFLFLTSLSGSTATADPPAMHSLKPGAAVVFVTDGPLAAGRREGDVVAVHLRSELAFEGTVLAAPGTRAELVYGSKSTDPKHPQPITLERFFINAGRMPVRAVQPIVAPLASGSEIAAVTLGEVDHIGDRWSIRLPFPFRLSGDRPASTYTPTPARTAPPRSVIRRGPSPSPSPSASPAASLSPAASPSPPQPSSSP